MDRQKAIKFLNNEIRNEGTNTDPGKVLVTARDRIRTNVLPLDNDWLTELTSDLYYSTTNSTGYGDSDWIDMIETELRELLEIEPEEEEAG